VIISELQGGENDPDQLLDIEVTATAFKAHPYRHPTIGWLGDLQAMTRDELYGFYRRYYVPSNATLVVVGDVSADEALRLVEKRFGSIPAGPDLPHVRTREPEQIGERRITIEKEGTTAYLKFAYHVPAVSDEDFFPALVLDAVLTGAKGLNLWSSFRGTVPQRRARLYRALVDHGLASAVSGAVLPTAHPFLQTISMTAVDGVPLDALEQAALEEIDRVQHDGVTTEEVERAKRQLRARLVFETDSVTNIAHQLGFFETVATADVYLSLAPSIARVTADQVGAAARRYLRPANRTVGRFQPLAVKRGEAVA
jgi:zinc protease